MQWGAFGLKGILGEEDEISGKANRVELNSVGVSIGAKDLSRHDQLKYGNGRLGFEARCEGDGQYRVQFYLNKRKCGDPVDIKLEGEVHLFCQLRLKKASFTLLP